MCIRDKLHIGLCVVAGHEVRARPEGGPSAQGRYLACFTRSRYEQKMRSNLAPCFTLTFTSKMSCANC